jgi:hypothetical protein
VTHDEKHSNVHQIPVTCVHCKYTRGNNTLPVGRLDGRDVGCAEGVNVGLGDGRIDGFGLGLQVGIGVGFGKGFRVCSVGIGVGDAVVGLEEGDEDGI